MLGAIFQKSNSRLSAVVRGGRPAAELQTQSSRRMVMNGFERHRADGERGDAVSLQSGPVADRMHQNLGGVDRAQGSTPGSRTADAVGLAVLENSTPVTQVALVRVERDRVHACGRGVGGGAGENGAGWARSMKGKNVGTRIRLGVSVTGSRSRIDAPPSPPSCGVSDSECRDPAERGPRAPPARSGWVGGGFDVNGPPVQR